MLDNRSSDLDALVEYSPWSRRWSALLGWRSSAVSIDRGRQWQEQLLIGASGPLPRLLGDRVHPSFGLQYVVTMVRHGHDLETDWFSVASDRHSRDTLSINLFLRVDYVSAL